MKDRSIMCLCEGTGVCEWCAIIEWDIKCSLQKKTWDSRSHHCNGMGKNPTRIGWKMYTCLWIHLSRKVVLVFPQVLLTVANKVQPENIDLVVSSPRKIAEKVWLGANSPLNPNIGNPTVKELHRNFCKVLFGDNFINNQAGEF